MDKKKKRSKFDIINEKLDKILKKEDQQLKEQEESQDLEEEQLEEDKEIESLEKEQLKDIEELEKLEKSIKREVSKHPLTKITKKDVSKGMVGAFVGVLSHFAFAKGVELSQQITTGRASLLYLVSFIIGFIFIYTTGYRKVKQIKLMKLVPLRVVVIYLVSLITVVIVLSLFSEYNTLNELYKQVAVISLPAILGAVAADLIGKG